jgi:hypothetical protein
MLCELKERFRHISRKYPVVLEKLIPLHRMSHFVFRGSQFQILVQIPTIVTQVVSISPSSQGQGQCFTSVHDRLIVHLSKLNIEIVVEETTKKLLNEINEQISHNYKQDRLSLI